MSSFKRAALVSALSLTAATAYAQSPGVRTAPVVQIDSRFSQWVGCWRLENDVTGSGVRVCVIPDKVYNVRMETLAGAQRGEIESIVPDGVAHAVNDPTCKGTETSRWSKDGERVFRWADVTCGNEGARKLSSVIFIADGPVLVEVQHVGAGIDQNVRVKRYRRSLDQSLPDGTIAPQPSLRNAEVAVVGSWDIDDVIEASRTIPGDAVQAALTEVDQPFDLNKKSLVAMADAKVDTGVIDLMVALTYPKKLQVTRSSGGGGGGGGEDMGLMGLAVGGFGPMYDPFYSPIIPANCFSMYNYGYYANYAGQCGWYYGSQFRYQPYGYYSGFYGGYGYYGGNYYPWVPVGGVPPAAGGGTPQPEGRVVNGRGYTQITPRQPEPSSVAGRGNGGSNGSYSGSNGATSSGSSGATSSGYSSGSSSGSSGGGERTAVSRPPGGN